MCLGELAEVIEPTAGRTALVRSGGRVGTVSLLALSEPLSEGDWVVCHSGFVLSRLTAEEARDAVALRGHGGVDPRPDPHPTMNATTTEDLP